MKVRTTASNQRRKKKPIAGKTRVWQAVNASNLAGYDPPQTPLAMTCLKP
jgi:hypothetical protein